MMELAAALLVLIATHSVPALPGIRPRLVDAFGLTGFRVAYSVVSLAVVAWLVGAYGRAEDSTWLWTPPDGGRLAAVALMPLSFWLIAVRLMCRPGKARTSVYRTIAAPGSAGVTLWAALHLLNVGQARAVLLFAVFALIALLAWIKNTRTAPDAAPAGESAGWRPAAMAAAAALIAWTAMLAAHPYVIGPDPLAGLYP